MFNDVFWFMYLVSWGERLISVGVIMFLISLVWVIARGIYISDNLYGDEATEATTKNLKTLRVYATLGLVILLAGAAYPSKETFYAGAGYYVAEQTEMTDTVMSLKTLLDSKIEELNDATSE